MDNAHSEYLMQLAGGGVLGLVLFLAWVAALLVMGWRGPSPAAILGCVVLAFAVGCLFNSWLRDFIEGHYLMALLAWYMARARQARALSSRT